MSSEDVHFEDGTLLIIHSSGGTGRKHRKLSQDGQLVLVLVSQLIFKFSIS
jgi:hypothetical protein